MMDTTFGCLIAHLQKSKNLTFIITGSWLVAVAWEIKVYGFRTHYVKYSLKILPISTYVTDQNSKDVFKIIMHLSWRHIIWSWWDGLKSKKAQYVQSRVCIFNEIIQFFCCASTSIFSKVTIFYSK